MLFQELPGELILAILNRLPLADAVSLLRVSHKMNSFIKDDTIWRKFGAANFVNFVERMQKLPPRYQRMILDESRTLGGQKYNLTYVENLIGILKLPTEDEFKKRAATHNSLSVLINTYTNFYWDTNKRMALYEGLITPEQFVTLPAKYISSLCLTNGNIAVLREGLITVEQAAAMPSSGHLSTLFDCIDALREGLITPEQAAVMPTPKHIFNLFLYTTHVNALRSGLITPEEIAKIHQADLINGYIENKINEDKSALTPPPALSRKP